MIQRQQTLWLLLATIAAILSFMFPFVTGKVMVNNVETDMVVKADKNFILLILTGASFILSGFTIFLFKNRVLQMQLCLVGLLLAAGILILYIVEMGKLSKSTVALAAILPVAVLLGYLMAWRNIRKDEKLVKSLDKLR